MKDLRTALKQAAGEDERSRISNDIARKEQESEDLLLAVRTAREDISALEKDIAFLYVHISKTDKMMFG